MQLVRFGDEGHEKAGLIDTQGRLRDLTSIVPDITAQVLANHMAEIAAVDEAALPLVTGTPRLGACVGNVGKFMCIGLNYSDHAAETGAKVPAHPILFMKATSAIAGPNDKVM